MAPDLHLPVQEDKRAGALQETLENCTERMEVVLEQVRDVWDVMSGSGVM